MIPADEAQVFLQQAQTFWQQREWQLTIQACANALALNQTLTDAHKLMGDALQRQDKTKEAIGYYVQAIALDPNFAEVYANLGALYAKQQRWDQAIVHYQKAIKVKPEFVGVYHQLVKVYQQLQQPEQVQFYLTQANALDRRSQNTLVNSLEQQQPSNIIGSNTDGSRSLVQGNNTQPLAEYLHQGKLLKQQGETEAALEQYLQAAKLEPQRVGIYEEILTLYEDLELWSEAAKYCRIILSLTSTSSTSNKSIASSSTTSNSSFAQTVNQPSAPASLSRTGPEKKSFQSHTEEAEYHFNLGTQSSRQQEWSEAVQHFQQAIALDPQMAKAYRDLARAQAQLGDQEQSAEYWLKAISLESEGVSGLEYLELGQNLASWGKQQSAVTCYRRAIAQQPELIDAYLRLGEFLVQSQENEEAIACYVEGLKYAQDNSELYYRLGHLYHSREQWPQAALCFQKATQYAPDHGPAYHQLGEVLSHQSQWAEAIAAYRQAIKFNPEFSWSYNNLGYALIQLNQWAEAIPVYCQAIKLNPEFPWAHFNLAEAYRELGQWNQAVDSYQQTVKLQPDLPKIHQKLGDALYHRSQEDRKVALEHFRLAIQQDPQDPEAYHSALAIDKTNLELYLQLGDVLAKLGQVEQAIVTYQMALQIQPKNGDAIARLQQVLLKQDPDCNVQQYLSNSQHSSPISTPRVEYSQSDLKF